MSNCTTKYPYRARRLKIKHLTREEALQHAAEVQPLITHQLSVYRCPDCTYWHVGRQMGRWAWHKVQSSVKKHDELLADFIIASLRGHHIPIDKIIEQRKLPHGYSPAARAYTLGSESP